MPLKSAQSANLPMMPSHYQAEFSGPFRFAAMMVLAGILTASGANRCCGQATGGGLLPPPVVSAPDTRLIKQTNFHTRRDPNRPRNQVLQASWDQVPSVQKTDYWEKNEDLMVTNQEFAAATVLTEVKPYDFQGEFVAPGSAKYRDYDPMYEYQGEVSDSRLKKNIAHRSVSDPITSLAPSAFRPTGDLGNAPDLPLVDAHFGLKREWETGTARIPSPAIRPVSKTPFSYGFFGAGRNRHWSRHHGYRDRQTDFRYR